MRKVGRAVAKAEKGCHDLLDILVEVKAKKVKVDVADLEQFVEESERLRAVLDRALVVEKEEEQEAEEEDNGEKGKEATKGKKLKAQEKGSSRKPSVIAARPRREKKAPRRVEEVESDAEKPQRKRRVQKELDEQEEEEENEKEEEEEREEKEREKNKQNQVVLRLPMKKLKQGDASRGPEGELILFFGKQGNSTVECPVFGKEYDEEFGMGGLFFISPFVVDPFFL
jgi:chemotaxis protein histidine kinase CheA